jgi:WD40 repeat protein
MDYPRNGFVPDVRCLVSPHGDRVAVLDVEKGLRRVVYTLPGWRETPIRDVPAAEALSHLRGLNESPETFSLDSRVLAVPGASSLFVWDADSGERIAALDYSAGSFISGRGERHFAVSDDGTRIVSQGTDKAVLWDLSGRRPVRTLDVDAAEVHGLFFSPDGLWLAASAGACLRIWDAVTGAPVGTLPAESRISDLSWSPDGRRIAYGTVNGDFSLIALENMTIGDPLAFAWIGPPQKRGLFGRATTAPQGLRVRCPVCQGWSESPAETVGGGWDCGVCGRRLRISSTKLEGDWRRLRL